MKSIEGSATFDASSTRTKPSSGSGEKERSPQAAQLHPRLVQTFVSVKFEADNSYDDVAAAHLRLARRKGGPAKLSLPGEPYAVKDIDAVSHSETVERRISSKILGGTVRHFSAERSNR